MVSDATLVLALDACAALGFVQDLSHVPGATILEGQLTRLPTRRSLNLLLPQLEVRLVLASLFRVGRVHDPHIYLIAMLFALSVSTHMAANDLLVIDGKGQMLPDILLVEDLWILRKQYLPAVLPSADRRVIDWRRPHILYVINCRLFLQFLDAVCEATAGGDLLNIAALRRIVRTIHIRIRLRTLHPCGLVVCQRGRVGRLGRLGHSEPIARLRDHHYLASVGLSVDAPFEL